MGIISKVLLIDDDFVNNFLSKRIIQRSGITKEVSIATNGRDGLQQIVASATGKGSCPEVILLDNHMPVMDGIEFLKKFRELTFQNLHEVVIVLLTHTLNTEDIETYRSLGIKEFMMKPLNEGIFTDLANRYFMGKSVS